MADFVRNYEIDIDAPVHAEVDRGPDAVGGDGGFPRSPG